MGLAEYDITHFQPVLYVWSSPAELEDGLSRFLESYDDATPGLLVRKAGINGVGRRPVGVGADRGQARFWYLQHLIAVLDTKIGLLSAGSSLRRRRASPGVTAARQVC